MGREKKTDPALIVFQLFLFSLQYAAGVSLEAFHCIHHLDELSLLTGYVPIVARRL